MEPPTIRDVVAARKRIAPHLPPTPLHTYPLLNDLLGAEAFVKHENHNPTGAFKIRGGLNLVAQLTPDERARGVITASTGNHGQSIALAAKIYGVKAIICVPKGANPIKVASIRSYGATILEEGADYDEARLIAESTAKKQGLRYIHSANEPHLIAGVGTLALEMIEDQPELDAVIAPVGAGTCACGTAIAYKAISPETKIIAVQTQVLPAVYNSWHSGKLESTPPAKTIADGLGTRQAFELPVQILRRLADDFVLVSEPEINAAIKHYVEDAHTIAEGAGAAPLAAAIKLREELKGKKVGVILTGANITGDALRDILNTP
jgi:threonine dehydratase